jgi:DnaK suppressor protein
MRPLRNTQLRSLQSLLLDQRRALLESESERQVGASRVEAALSNRESPVDAAREDSSVSEMELELAERGNLELATVTAALSRIDAGTYGICLDCGQPIPYTRVLAAPSAVSCIHCQSRTEAGR